MICWMWKRTLENLSTTWPLVSLFMRGILEYTCNHSFIHNRAKIEKKHTLYEKNTIMATRCFNSHLKNYILVQLGDFREEFHTVKAVNYVKGKFTLVMQYI